jgi:hypothetical protein
VRTPLRAGQANATTGIMERAEDAADMGDYAPEPPPPSAANNRGGQHVRCAFCGRSVAGYDHHCVWLDACIGAHNIGVFTRGLLALLGGLLVEGTLFAARALQRRRWGIDAVLAVYATVLCVALLALLCTLALNRARGLTAYEVRWRRRRAEPIPPLSWGSLLWGTSAKSSLPM